MNNFNSKKHSIIPTAIITTFIFAFILWSIFYPLKFHKLTTVFSNKFDTTQDFVKFFDVGQADCALIYSNGYSCVVDVGEPFTANDIAMKLYDCKIDRIDTVLISHLHSDHIGALPQFADIFKIDNLIMPFLQSGSLISAHTGKNSAVKNGANFYHAEQGTNFKIGEFEITLLATFWDKTNENNRSVFLMAEIDGVKFLFAGDAEKEAENSLLSEQLNLDCDVLKVAHHGSNSATQKSFLKATTPDYAVISVGIDNEYGHPHEQTLNTLANQGVKLFRTDQSGDITFFINNGEITVTEEK